MNKGMEVPPWAAAVVIVLVVVVLGWFLWRGTGARKKIDMSSPEFAAKMKAAMGASHPGAAPQAGAPR